MKSVSVSKIPTLKQMYDKNLIKVKKAERVSLYQGDITLLKVDAIVNAANKTLLGGGGVDRAIHACAGPKLLAECRMLEGCDTGDAKMTKGYKLPAKYVIHTVGPVYSSRHSSYKARQLASCYHTCLSIAVSNRLRTIAFPSISTGAYGFPLEEAAKMALEVTSRFLESEQARKIERVIFVVYSDNERRTYENLMPVYFPRFE